MMVFTLVIQPTCGEDSRSTWKAVHLQLLTGGPWKLIYYEAYTEEADALGRERYLKSGGGRRFLRLQLAHYLKKNPIRGEPRE